MLRFWVWVPFRPVKSAGNPLAAMACAERKNAAFFHLNAPMAYLGNPTPAGMKCEDSLSEGGFRWHRDQPRRQSPSPSRGPHHGHDPSPDGIGQAVPDGGQLGHLCRDRLGLHEVSLSLGRRCSHTTAREGRGANCFAFCFARRAAARRHARRPKQAAREHPVAGGPGLTRGHGARRTPPARPDWPPPRHTPDSFARPPSLAIGWWRTAPSRG